MPLTNEAAEIMVHMSIARDIEQAFEEQFKGPRVVETTHMGNRAWVDTVTGDYMEEVPCEPGSFVCTISIREATDDTD